MLSNVKSRDLSRLEEISQSRPNPASGSLSSRLMSNVRKLQISLVSLRPTISHDAKGFLDFCFYLLFNYFTNPHTGAKSEVRLSRFPEWLAKSQNVAAKAVQMTTPPRAVRMLHKLGGNNQFLNSTSPPFPASEENLDHLLLQYTQQLQDYELYIPV